MSQQQQQQQIPSSKYQSNYTMSYPNTSTSNKLELSDQSMVYPASSFYSPSSNSYYYDLMQKKTCSPSSIMIQDPPMLVASSSSTTTASTMSSSSVDLLNEAFAKATSLPESFYPEFLQYSKESYEQSTGNGPHRKKQKRTNKEEEQQTNDLKLTDSDEENSGNLSSSEIRRQIHIQSEQKRRAQIKDGFEELRSELPACLNKKMSKVALLHRTVQHIQHLKDTQTSILSELERLVHENEQLRKFQESVLQKQALENMYTMTNM